MSMNDLRIKMMQFPGNVWKRMPEQTSLSKPYGNKTCDADRQQRIIRILHSAPNRRV